MMTRLGFLPMQDEPPRRRSWVLRGRPAPSVCVEARRPGKSRRVENAVYELCLDLDPPQGVGKSD